MDAYVREFGADGQHDTFYLNQTIVSIFKNFTTQVVKRYIDSPAILAWELANDPRCGSSLAASNVCNTTTVTGWHADVGAHVQSVDPNHLVSSGAHGFPCADCPKLFPLAPPPTVSATPQRRKRSIKPLTNERLLNEVKEKRKKTREAKKRALLKSGDGIRIRGRWIAARAYRIPPVQFSSLHPSDSMPYADCVSSLSGSGVCVTLCRSIGSFSWYRCWPRV